MKITEQDVPPTSTHRPIELNWYGDDSDTPNSELIGQLCQHLSRPDYPVLSSPNQEGRQNETRDLLSYTELTTSEQLSFLNARDGSPYARVAIGGVYRNGKVYVGSVERPTEPSEDSQPYRIKLTSHPANWPEK